MVYEFNCFQTITIDDPKVQHYPHIDSNLESMDSESVLNMLVYLDIEESGGTAIYHGEWITNDENMNLMYPVEERFKLDRVIEHKFNRCVIFAGNRMHGAYINDYNKYKRQLEIYSGKLFSPMLTTINKNVISEDDIKLIMNRWDRTDDKHPDSLGRLVWDFHHHENEKERIYHG